MQIIIGADHGGYELKEALKQKLLGFEFQDVGCDSPDSCDYPNFGQKVANQVVAQKTLGIVVCGTGIGISIAANKVNGARAALCTNSTLARLAREHNNANILALGGRIVGTELAIDIARTFLATDFTGAERHQRRINQIEND
jgi:ribose 5-phosphate isomerase B